MSRNSKSIKSFSGTIFYLVILVAVQACKQETIAKSIPADVCNKDLVESSHLISVAEAHKALKEEEHIVLIDVSPPTEYNKIHLPTAQNVWRPHFRTRQKESIPGMKCDATELCILLKNLGVKKESRLILYDRKGAVEACRMAWVLDFYGYDNYQIMNGGLQLWQDSGLETTDEILPDKPSSKLEWKPQIDSSILATIEDVQMAIHDSTTIIIDTREPYEYLGQPFIAKGQLYHHKKGAHINGCIPTALHLNWSELADLDNDHRLKCRKDLIYNLNQIGATPDKQIIVYCQSGSRSSHTAFVLSHILGYPRVKNYDGSWIEWSMACMQDGSVEIEQKTEENVIIDMIQHLESTISKNNG